MTTRTACPACPDCLAAQKAARARAIARYVHETPSGRFVIAEWSERNACYLADMSRRARRSTGCHTVSAKSITGIACDPCVTKYTTRASAIRALDTSDADSRMCRKHEADFWREENARRDAEEARYASEVMEYYTAEPTDAALYADEVL